MTEEVQVWVAPLEVTEARYTDLAGTLAPEERRRADDLPPVLARRFVVARGILRDLLSGFTGTPARELKFEYGTAGKPSLADHNINFNISHSAELGLFAFAPDRAVGVDVENERPVRRLLDVAQRFMSEDEVRTLAATNPDQRDASFLRSWVVREARLKAEGKSVWSGQQSATNPGKLTHKLFSPRPGYIAAVAATDSDWRLYTCAVNP
ncbi:MAG TPA: 4'-phosphopantetheinyl transferase superfamily protein [Gemmatimonadaceae bacterium]|jgi:4'-phosphopantetheinyl transferase|nr:4'-phosphopantetheinyl transferase superfamily protein [Gemmatimonadaceae bacterium]